MIKFRWHYNKDSEETFLNEMSQEGYAMEKYFLGFYYFKPTNPGEYTYRVDLIQGKTKEENNMFYDLVREAGGEVVQTWGYWVFFRKKGEFELYSDRESQITQYQKIKRMYLGVGILELGISIIQMISYISSKEPLHLVLSTLFLVVFISFMIQVWTCSKKISELSMI